MITSEQKDLCIKLYLEDSHTIKDIIEQTNLKYAPEVYQILDEADIPRKRKYPSRKQSAPQEIDIESSRMKYLFGMCRIYDNEPENPYDEKEEPFKRYMWRNEWKILQNAKEEKNMVSALYRRFLERDFILIRKELSGLSN